MPGKSNYFFTTRLWLLYQSPQSPHGILATRGRFTKNGENQVFNPLEPARWFFKGRVQPLMCLYVI